MDPCDFKGGLRQGLKNANWPDAVLRADGQTLSIRTGGPLMDDIEVARSEMTTIRSVRGLLSRGLRFETNDGRLDGVIYWTPPRRHREVRAALRERGWPVA